MKQGLWGVTSVFLMGLFWSGTAWAQCQGSMVKASKNVIAEVGKEAPDFKLKGMDGKEVTLSSFKGKTVVLEWFNPGCPFVKRVHLENGPMPAMAKQHLKSGGVWLAINSGAPGNQGTGVETNQRAVQEYSMQWPLLLDESGEVGRLYAATKTPQVFVIDGSGVVVYAGGVDSTKGGGYGEEEFTNYLQNALDEVSAGKPVTVATTPAWGCSVKYAK